MSNDKEAAKGKDAEKDEDKAKAGEGDGDANAEAKPKGRFGFITGLLKIKLSRKMLMFVVAPAVLLLVVGVGAYFFLFSGGEKAADGSQPGEAGKGETAQADPIVHPVFYDIPDILVNVAAGGDKPAFLKLSVSLELEGEGEAAKAAIEPVVPRVVDQLQTYLRELRVEDLSGSAAVFRLKEELLRRVNLAVEPVKVKDVLFREMIVQ
jgi:flagellar FliL protein